MTFKEIRDAETFNSDRWLYAAVRAADKGEPAHLFAVLEALKRRTPRQIIRMFPPTKEYDGARTGCKDYYTTMQAVGRFAPDKRLGGRVRAFLWDYMNPHLEGLYVSLMCCRVNRAPARARAVIREYRRQTPVVSVYELCKGGAEWNVLQILNVVKRIGHGLYVTDQGPALDLRTFFKAKPPLYHFIKGDNLEAHEKALRNRAGLRGADLEFSFCAAVLTRKQAAAAPAELAADIREARIQFGLLGRIRNRLEWLKATASIIASDIGKAVEA
jgi:hypothetical protein